MNTNRKPSSKSNRIALLATLLDDDSNLSTEYVRYLRALARTGDPSAAPIIARFLDMAGMVGRFAASSLLRLVRSAPECLEVVLQICEERVETSLDSDEIRNASHVCTVLARRRVPALQAA